MYLYDSLLLGLYHCGLQRHICYWKGRHVNHGLQEAWKDLGLWEVSSLQGGLQGRIGQKEELSYDGLTKGHSQRESRSRPGSGW